MCLALNENALSEKFAPKKQLVKVPRLPLKIVRDIEDRAHLKQSQNGYVCLTNIKVALNGVLRTRTPPESIEQEASVKTSVTR